MFSLTKYRKFLINKVHKADKYFGLFKDDETVILGISGGEDSLFMADILYHYRIKFNRTFKMIGVHIDNGLKPLKDLIRLQKFLKERDIQLEYVEDRDTVYIIENRIKPFKPCYICAKERRKRLIYKAKEKGANKIALAHTIDDAIETLLLNLFYAREISTMVPKQPLFSETFFIIRPIILIEKEEILKYLKLAGLNENLEGECPYAEQSRRETVRTVLSFLYKKDPQVKKNLKYSLFECKEDYLWKKYRAYRKKIVG